MHRTKAEVRKLIAQVVGRSILVIFQASRYENGCELLPASSFKEKSAFQLEY